MTTQEFLLSNWPLHPAVFAAAAATLCIYAWHGRISGRGTAGRSGFLAAAVAVVLLALDSPVDVLASGYLFSAHMLQHLLLLLIVPPLLLLAWGEARERPADSAKHTGLGSSEARQPGVQQAQRLVTRPLLSWVAGVGAMWLWHVPVLCSAATTHSTVRSVQAVSLVALGTLFWLPILSPRLEHRLPSLAGVLYLFTACVGCTLLGIIITFAPVSVCPAFLHPPHAVGVLALIRNRWGLSPSVDQQIGGLLMWVPACLIYACGIVGLLGRWYAAAGTESPGPRRQPTRAHEVTMGAQGTTHPT